MTATATTDDGDNASGDGYGGCASILRGSLLTLTAASISGCSANSETAEGMGGGALHIASESRSIWSAASFVGNSSTTGRGGAVYVQARAEACAEAIAAPTRAGLPPVIKAELQPSPCDDFKSSPWATARRTDASSRASPNVAPYRTVHTATPHPTPHRFHAATPHPTPHPAPSTHASPAASPNANLALSSDAARAIAPSK